MVTDVRLHGSGPAIGNALKLEGMNMARVELKAEKLPIAVGSNKGNCEVISSSSINSAILTRSLQAAGGLISVIKMCKLIQNGMIPPMPSLERLVLA